MAVTSKKILDANISTCAVAGTAEEVSSFIQAVDGKISKIVNGTQEITPSDGVADLSALFTSVDSSTDPQPTGLLSNAVLDKAIVKVATSLFDNGETEEF